MPPAPSTDLLRIDDQLTDEERLVRDTAREFAAERVEPHIADWFEAGMLPREISPELGKLGMLGMHLTGYGCAGAGAVAYGVACRELEASDSGLRSFVSVQGSLAMYPIQQVRLGGAEAGVAAADGRRRGHRLLRPHRARPRLRPGEHAHHAKRDGSDWVSQRHQDVDHQRVASPTSRSCGRVPTTASAGSWCPAARRGFTARDIHKKLSLRASVTSELHLDDVRLPRDAMLPEVTGLKGPLSCLSEARYGIVWGATGAARTC